MKIKSVRIRNFRALKDLFVSFDSITTFIGPNGAGKSTVLRALDWYFNGRPGSLTDADCSFGAAGEDVEVQVTFTGLSAMDRAALGKYSPVDVDSFTAWKRRSPDGTEVLSANQKGFPAFNEIKAAGTATLKRELYSVLRRDNPRLDLPAVTTGQAVDQAITAWEAAHTDQLADVPEALQTNFFGFNSGSKMSGLFDFVLVTADLRASEESVDGRGSIVGRILERSIDRTSADQAIAEVVAESREKQRKIYDEKFKDQIGALTDQLNSVVAGYAPGRTITVAPADVEFKAPRTTFSVAVLDGTTETAVERQGHGFQRTLLISALQLLAQSGAASTEGVICLAIEEPELFQHPIQAHAFAKILRSLAEDPEKRLQITYATHSPYFLEARNFHQVRRLTRSEGVAPVVTVHFATVEHVKSRLEGVIDSNVVDRRLDSNVAEQLAVALFANRVLIVEGLTEAAVFYGIGDRTSPGSLEVAGLSIVPVGSKMSIPLAHAILDCIGVPVYALFDADGGFESRALANGKSEDGVQLERRNHAAENKKLLRYFKFPEEDFPAESVREGVAIFGDQLESYLSAAWPDWAVACETTEAETGICVRKNTQAYRIATLRASGAVPEMLVRILGRVLGD